MAQDVRSGARTAPAPAGSGLRVAVVCGRFYDHVTERLLAGARRGLEAGQVRSEDISELWVPGAFEIPTLAMALARSGSTDAIVALGCVIRGDTAHFEHVAGQCARGVQQVGLETGIPVGFGVLTTEDLEQALVRSQPRGGHNAGEEAARTAVEMANLLAAVAAGPPH